MMVQIEYDDVVPVLPAKSTTNNNNSFLDRLHRVEKHLRKNKLKLTLTERLGAAHMADDVSSQAEAKKLAFYLFWNCKSSFERFAYALSWCGIIPPARHPWAPNIHRLLKLHVHSQ